MNTYRKTAIIVGILFIVGTVAGVLSVICLTPIQNHPDFLVNTAENTNRAILGTLFILAMGFSLAIIPVLMFPVLKKYHETLALGYVVFRGGLETVTYIGLATCGLVLILLSQNLVQSSATSASYFQISSDLVLGTQDSINTMLIIVFSLGALMLYTVLYQSKLIPRWLSGWGFIAILMHLSTACILIFGLTDVNSPIITVINLPIFLQEMVMAVWLIAKGFDSTPIQRVSI